MSTLFTLVGKQPAAVAVTVKTLLKHKNLQHVILLHTTQTQAQAERLTDFFATLPNKLAVATHCVLTDSRDAGTLPFAWEVIHKCLQDNDLPKPRYFDASSGLNYQVASIAYFAAQDASMAAVKLQPLYATFNQLINLHTSAEKWDLEDIGLNNLLTLFNLRSRPNNLSSSGPVSNLVILTDNGPVLQLKWAVERRGRLHGLLELKRKHGPNIDYQEESHRLKQEARKIAALLETPALINRLEPILTVATNDRNTDNRLRAFGIKRIFNSSNPRQEWEAGLEQEPGQETAGEVETLLDLSQGPDHLSLAAGGEPWTGTNLIVALGSDPSATLLAIFTHKPKELIVLVDRETPLVLNVAARLKKLIEEKETPFKLAAVTFWPVDILGNTEPAEALHTHLLQSPQTLWDINITPGTKAQTWKLSQIGAQNPENTRLWSLDTKAQVASPLSASGVKSLPFQYPPVIIQATCRAGSIKDHGSPLEEIANQKDCLQKMINIVSKKAEQDANGRCLKPGPWAVNKKIILSISKRKGNKKTTEKSSITCKEINIQKQKLKFSVVHNKQSCQVEIRSKPEGGFWLEPLIAAAFLSASSQRVPYRIDDMRVGLRPAVLYQTEDQDKFRADIDIALLWQGQYIGVSCKSFIDEGDIEELEATRSEIIAETRKTLGRFALPVLVRGGIPPGIAKERAEESIELEPLEIALSLLKDSEYLRNLIELALKAKKTTAKA